ncbi:hypothetical protein [Endozoicomonas sp. SCSIO W0465]|uniref:hypothetical protein n=1 Tax=Endozoicomonas sp. SCSIO W0465 TaxID=2918516 RepID=UPI002075CDC7|nr:hypothetical protein [Endozoicomonas sp. SCSIO W0465]USE37241.1 hypothetical protein MJO57_03145 [Endozoicomonas sp. SCSIO W0465]
MAENPAPAQKCEVRKQRQTLVDQQVFIITNGNLLYTASKNCWEVQSLYQEKLHIALKAKFGYTIRPANPAKEDKGHGLISNLLPKR